MAERNRLRIRIDDDPKSEFVPWDAERNQEWNALLEHYFWGKVFVAAIWVREKETGNYLRMHGASGNTAHVAQLVQYLFQSGIEGNLATGHLRAARDTLEGMEKECAKARGLVEAAEGDLTDE